MSRQVISLDQGWKFHLGDIVSIRNRWAWGKSGSWNQGPESRDFDDNAWREVSLPHDFVIETAPYEYSKKEFDEKNTIPERHCLEQAAECETQFHTRYLYLLQP